MLAVDSISLSEKKQVLSLLALSFAADPFERWLYPDAQEYLENFPLFLDVLTAQSFETRQVYSFENAGAAVWLQPGVILDDPGIIKFLLQTTRPEKHAAILSMMEQMEDLYPREPYWYLDIIGVDPARQGLGIGAALLRHTLALCDRDHAPAYLESTNPRNLSLYQRHGFELMCTIQSGDAAPMFSMLRKPR